MIVSFSTREKTTVIGLSHRSEKILSRSKYWSRYWSDNNWERSKECYLLPTADNFKILGPKEMSEW